MKRLSLLGGLFICALILFTVTSCEDPITAPIVDLLDDGFGSVTGDVDVAAGSSITFSVSALQGDSPLQNVRFLEDGSLVTDFTNRLTINGSSASSANVLLFGADKENFTWEVNWVVHDGASANTYTIEVVDENGNSNSEAVLVNTDIAVTTPLSLTLATDGGPTGNSLSADASIDPDVFFRVTLSGVQGANALNRLEVQEDGSAITDLSRLYLNDITSANAFSANPYFVEGDDIGGFTLDVLVKAHSTENVAKVYAFILVDDQENFESVSLTITTNVTVPTGTPIDGNFSFVLMSLTNQAGPGAVGALDLDTGNQCGVSTTNTDTGTVPADAEIRDMGNTGGTNGTWRQKIGPMSDNNVTMKSLPTNPEFPVVFSSIQFKEEIEDAFNDPTSAVIPDTGVDVFSQETYLVKNNDSGTYYIIYINTVEIDAGGNWNNNRYVIDVKSTN